MRWGVALDRLQAGLRELTEGLGLVVRGSLSERVERLLLGVGGLCWGLGVSSTAPMAAAAAPPSGVLLRWLLARWRLAGVTPSLGLWAVAFDVPRGQAVVTGGRLIARIRMCGACGDVVAAVGAPVVADPAALLDRVVRGCGRPVVGGGRPCRDLADAHGLAGGLR